MDDQQLQKLIDEAKEVQKEYPYFEAVRRFYYPSARKTPRVAHGKARRRASYGR